MLFNSIKIISTITIYLLLSIWSIFASDETAPVSVKEQVAKGGPANNVSETATKKCRTETFPDTEANNVLRNQTQLLEMMN